MNRFIKFRYRKLILPFSLILFLIPFHGFSEDAAQEPFAFQSVRPDYVLTKAVMCERVNGSTPVNPAIVFSFSKKNAFCYSVFEPVLAESYISHNWYYKDKIVSRFKRLVKPSNRWETFSSHKIGSKTKGPWRVEITDSNGEVLSILRFSVTD